MSATALAQRFEELVEPGEATASTGTRARRWSRHAPLTAILLLQAAVSLSLHNTAFTDEALYLYAGHLEIEHLLHNAPIYQNFASYFSGSPWIYPPIAAMLDGLGGLEAARDFSLLLMLVATGLVYGIGRRVVGERAGMLGALAFATLGPTLFLGHFATYDAMAICMLSLSAWCATRSAGESGAGRRALAWAAGTGAAAALGVMTKYAALLYLPSVACLLVLASPREEGVLPRRARLRRALARTSAAAAGFAAGMGALVAATGTSFLAGLASTTTNRPHGTNSIGQVASTTWYFLAPVLVLATAGAVLERRRGRRLLVAILAVTAFLAPAYQAHLHTIVSLEKHVDYGALFAAPVAGLTLARLFEWSRSHLSAVVANLALILAIALAGVSTARSAFGDWTDSRPLVQLVESQFRPVTGRYLVEDATIPEYYLESISEPFQWSSTYYFGYVDPLTHRYLTGLPAYTDAFAHRYFDVVVLSFGPTYSLDLRLTSLLDHSRNYRRIADLPYGPAGRRLFAWRLRTS